MTQSSEFPAALATHSSTLAWKIPGMEEPGGLQPMGSLGVGHDWATSLSLSCIGEGNGNPLQCSCLENPRDGGAWWAAVYGVTQSQTRLKRLSMVLRKEEYTPGLTAIRLEPLPKMNPRELRMWKMEGSWPQDRWDAWTEWFQWTQTLAPSHTEQSANFLPWDIWFSLLHKNTFEVQATCPFLQTSI